MEQNTFKEDLDLNDRLIRILNYSDVYHKVQIATDQGCPSERKCKNLKLETICASIIK